MRILIAEDEVSIGRALKVLLEKERYTVDLVHNGNDAVDYIEAAHYDALVLDIMMPGRDGIEVLTTVRAHGNTTPALFLTAKGEIEDRVAGLDAGADDYLPKPFATSELLARVRALVRRSERLNNKEFQLMELFLRHPRQVFSSERLMEHVWGFDSEAGIDVVWTYIGFLRKKLKQLGTRVEIRTIRGAGYALEGGTC